jgi:hypothetical protein
MIYLLCRTPSTTPSAVGTSSAAGESAAPPRPPPSSSASLVGEPPPSSPCPAGSRFPGGARAPLFATPPPRWRRRQPRRDGSPERGNRSGPRSRAAPTQGRVGRGLASSCGPQYPVPRPGRAMGAVRMGLGQIWPVRLFKSFSIISNYFD